MNWKNSRYATSNNGKKNDLVEEEEWTLKGYIDHMASINHPLSIPAVKGFCLGAHQKKYQSKQIQCRDWARQQVV